MMASLTTSVFILMFVVTVSMTASAPVSDDRKALADSIDRIISKRSGSELVNAVMLAPRTCLPNDDFHIYLETLIQMELSRMRECISQQNIPSSISN